MAKKIFVLFLGLIFSFLSFEFFLRVFYGTEKQRPQVQTVEAAKTTTQGPAIENPHEFNILFLGNSHTYGAGVTKEHAYAGVLNSFFQRNLKNTNFKVNIYNAGMLAANTTDIYENLDRFIIDSKPQIALIMAGEPNFWNKNGYGAFLSNQNSAEYSFLNQNLQTLSQYSKAIKWLLSIQDLSDKQKIPEQTLNEIAVYKEITLTEDHYIKRIEDTLQNRNTLALFQKYIETHTNEPPKGIWRTILYIYGRYSFYLNHDSNSVIKSITESLKSDPETFDVMSYLLIQEIEHAQNMSPADRTELNQLYQKLIRHPGFLGPALTELHINYTLKSQREVLNKVRNEEEFLVYNQKIFPAFAVPAMGLRQYYLKQQQPEKAHQAVLKTLTINPFAQRDNIQKFFVEDSKNQPNDSKIKMSISSFVEHFKKKFPSESFVFDTTNEEKIYDWITWDLERIQKKLSANHIPLVIQNYHWIRDMHRGQKINARLFETAQKLGTQFIDTSELFQQTANTSGQVESYFVQSFGLNDSHPSEKGHRLIAYIIYKNMVAQKLLPDEISKFDAEEILKVYE